MAILGMKRFRTEGVDVGEVESADVAADLLMMLSRRTGGGVDVGRRLFRCKSCGRQFPSFQALGGHRASHKKPRVGGEPQAQAAAVPEKPRAHECPVCGVEFAMGQALGGHMRRHRTGTGAFPLVLAEEKKPAGAMAAAERPAVVSLNLDLSLAPPADRDGDFCSLRLGLGHPVVGFLC